jgi:hypothetical protein
MKTTDLMRERWSVTKSGVSVDAGKTRIRQEAAEPREVLAARARIIASAPDGYRLALMLQHVVKRREDAAHSNSGGVVLLPEGEWEVLVGAMQNVLTITGDIP